MNINTFKTIIFNINHPLSLKELHFHKETINTLYKLKTQLYILFCIFGTLILFFLSNYKNTIMEFQYSSTIYFFSIIFSLVLYKKSYNSFLLSKEIQKEMKIFDAIDETEMQFIKKLSNYNGKVREYFCSAKKKRNYFCAYELKALTDYVYKKEKVDYKTFLNNIVNANEKLEQIDFKDNNKVIKFPKLN